MKEKFLPIGTVVTLKEATKKIMIIGYCPIDQQNKNKVYDYVACTYPEGVLSSDRNLVFNHNQIEKIDNIGLEIEEYEKFNNYLKDVINNIESIKNIELPNSNENL